MFGMGRAIAPRPSRCQDIDREDIDIPRYTGHPGDEGFAVAANKVRDARRRSGLTQEELARKAKLSRSMLSLVENARAVPSVYTGKNLAKALGTSIDRLFPGPGPAVRSTKGGGQVARNTGSGGRVGAVRGRSQTKAPSGRAVKRDTTTGRFVDQKKTPGPYKGVRREK